MFSPGPQWFFSPKLSVHDLFGGPIERFPRAIDESNTNKSRLYYSNTLEVRLLVAAVQGGLFLVSGQLSFPEVSQRFGPLVSLLWFWYPAGLRPLLSPWRGQESREKANSHGHWPSPERTAHFHPHPVERTGPGPIGKGGLGNVALADRLTLRRVSSNFWWQQTISATSYSTSK